MSRKRKRHAVDPCLGFYLLSSGKSVSSPSIKSSKSSPSFGLEASAACTKVHEDTFVPSFFENKHGTEGVRDAQHLENLPGYGLHTPKRARRLQPENLGNENLPSSRNIVPSSRQLMMTVNDFLKRTNKTESVIKKQYGKPKRRIKRLGDNSTLFEEHGILESDAEDTGQGFMQLRSKKIRRATMYESSSDESSSLNHGESSPLEFKRKKPQGRIHKPLKERLYEAAVLTHGDPDDILVHGAGTVSELAPSRRPLRFVPDTQPELDNYQMDTKRRSRTLNFVDPRKSTAIRTASFSSKIRPYLQDTDPAFPGKTANLFVQHPKRWQFANAGLVSSSILKSNRQPKIPAVKRGYKYPPLALVSVKEAEEDYKSIFCSDK